VHKYVKLPAAAAKQIEARAHPGFAKSSNILQQNLLLTGLSVFTQ
jgi:hypothetical protein